MNPLKIAFSGAHSTGKTTAADALWKALGEEGYRGVRIGETARKCPFPINRDATPEAQKWIWEKQKGAEFTAMFNGGLMGRDFVLCDRTILDSLVYSAWHLENTPGWEDLPTDDMLWIDKALLRFSKEDVYGYSIIYLTEPDGRLPEADGVRDVDEAWRDDIALEFTRRWEAVLRSVPYEKRVYVKSYAGTDAALKDVKALMGARKA